MEQSFLVYALSVITSRALPDVRDGLKPVHRRILWTAHEEGFRPVLCLKQIAGVPLLLWKRLDEISADDIVVLSRQPSPAAVLAAGTDEEWQLGTLAGAFVAEGFVSETRAGFNNTDKAFFDDVLAAYDAVVGGPRYVYSRTLPSGRTLL